MKSLVEKINDLENRIKRLENGVVTDSISYGIVKHYIDWDLCFEQIDNKDAFVMRNKFGVIIGVFTEG